MEACQLYQSVNGCHACGLPGCWNTSERCTFIGGRREVHIDAQMGDSVPHVSQTCIRVFANGEEQHKGVRMLPHWWQDRSATIQIDGQAFTTGTASGENMNCLIDTLRQVLVGGLDWNVTLVGKRLEADFADVRPGDVLRCCRSLASGRVLTCTAK